ncbi:MAG: cob(I)yrinic acid a,c-diamide adenosyltransferase [Deltaproteobacteria bacterium]|nr:cob(I)yrinic acid a,c-diamide adenosyltransferase [Deltaproteobacteria bacterium]
MNEETEIQHLEPGKKVGLVVVITGNGKGKTTSALGIALRAAGHGMKVCLIQFMKGDIHSGELDSIKRLAPEVELHVKGKGFCGIMGNPYKFPEHRKDAQGALSLAKEKIASGDYDIVILDEINNSLKLKLVDLEQVLGLIDNKPAALHLVLTGRDAHPEVVFRAHTVSEIGEVKHAYRLGIAPQKGIDY